ncbi:MAG: Sensor protein KdpD [Elusimicrobia bacterium]|nr:Sensor protein KdpD [Elusimicrobiota bacterium]
MIYLLGTLVVATRGRRGPSALCATLGVLCFDFFFVPPRFTFSVADAQYIWTFLVMFITAMVISHLTIRLRSEAESAREGHRRTAMMHAFTQQLSSARSLEDVLGMAVRQISEVFNSDVVIFLPNSTARLETYANSGKNIPTEKEVGIAQWAYDQKQPAGLSTQSVPSDSSLYVPLLGTEGAVGVMSIRPRVKDQMMVTEQRLLLDSLAQQIALALEVERLQENAKKTEVEVETERLRSSLLSSVSHDLRTPLTAIVGLASTLLENEEMRKSPKGLGLLQTIQTEGQRLSRLVQNLLEATRLESGAVQIKKERYPLEEIVGSALGRLEKSLHGRKVDVKLPRDLPAVPLDGMLIEQVFINLLENAIRHTPARSTIDIGATLQQGMVSVTVADRGPGLNEADVERVFEKFFHDRSSSGAGLGLAICRAIVLAHGGKIWAENRTGGGALFRFTLPINENGR